MHKIKLEVYAENLRMRGRAALLSVFESECMCVCLHIPDEKRWSCVVVL